jgi:hypothetical protein
LRCRVRPSLHEQLEYARIAAQRRSKKHLAVSDGHSAASTDSLRFQTKEMAWPAAHLLCEMGLVLEQHAHDAVVAPFG